MKLIKAFFQRIVRTDVWARPQMPVTFRAEIMPGKTREERTFLVQTVLRNGHVILSEFPGEYLETQFEPINFRRQPRLERK